MFITRYSSELWVRCSFPWQLMTGCCAFGCSNHPEDGKKQFAIPNAKAKKARRKAWLQRIGRKGFTPSRTSRLCEVRRITFNALENIRQLLAIARIQMSTKLNLFHFVSCMSVFCVFCFLKLESFYCFLRRGQLVKHGLFLLSHLLNSSEHYYFGRICAC